MNNYILKVLEDVKKKNPNEPEFNQAALEILSTLDDYVSIHPELEKIIFLNDSLNLKELLCLEYAGKMMMEISK